MHTLKDLTRKVSTGTRIQPEEGFDVPVVPSAEFDEEDLEFFENFPLIPDKEREETVFSLDEELETGESNIDFNKYLITREATGTQDKQFDVSRGNWKANESKHVASELRSSPIIKGMSPGLSPAVLGSSPVYHGVADPGSSPASQGVSPKPKAFFGIGHWTKPHALDQKNNAKNNPSSSPSLQHQNDQSIEAWVQDTQKPEVESKDETVGKKKSLFKGKLWPRRHSVHNEIPLTLLKMANIDAKTSNAVVRSSSDRRVSVQELPKHVPPTKEQLLVELKARQKNEERKRKTSLGIMNRIRSYSTASDHKHPDREKPQQQNEGMTKHEPRIIKLGNEDTKKGHFWLRRRSSVDLPIITLQKPDNDHPTVSHSFSGRETSFLSESPKYSLLKDSDTDIFMEDGEGPRLRKNTSESKKKKAGIFAHLVRRRSSGKRPQINAEASTGNQQPNEEGGLVYETKVRKKSDESKKRPSIFGQRIRRHSSTQNPKQQLDAEVEALEHEEKKKGVVAARRHSSLNEPKPEGLIRPPRVKKLINDNSSTKMSGRSYSTSDAPNLEALTIPPRLRKTSSDNTKKVTLFGRHSQDHSVAMNSKNNTTALDQPTSHSYSERGTNYFDQILKNIYNEHDNLTHLMKGRITPEKSEEPKRHNSFKENDQVKSPSEQVYSPSEQVYTPSEQVYSPSEQVGSPSEQVYSPSEQVYSPNGQIKASNEQIKAPPRRRRTGAVMLDHQPEEITPMARERVYSLERQAVYNNHREFLRGKFKAKFHVSESDDDADERVTGVEKEPNPSIWYVNSDSSNVPMVTSMMSSDAGNHGTNDKRSPAPRTKPKGTTEYEVKLHDTLASIAAQFDTTPSELIKLNKLVMRTVFPQQVLYVPDGSASLSDEDISTTPPPLVSPQEKIKFDVPLVKMADKPPAKIPGHVERQISPVSPPHDPEILLPHKLSEDEVETIDKECLERFIKINVKHITDGQGVVSGTLLVTPNAVMFDPNVSDPLVLEHGAEKYGMITPMDMVISAAMYHDIAAMKLRGQKGADTSLPKPQIYHTHTCPLYHHKDHLDSPDNNELATDLDSMRPSRSTTVESLLSEAGSMCSCGALSREASELNESVGNISTLDTSHTTPQKLSDIDSIIPQNIQDPLAYDSFDSEITVQSNIVPSQEDGSNLPSQGDGSYLPFQTDSIKQSSDNTTEGNINDTVKADILSENIVDSSKVIESNSEIVESSDAKPVSQTADESQKEVSEMIDTNEHESKIGSISYFPIEENAEGKLVVKGEEDTESALPKNLRVNTDIKEDLPQSQFSPLKVSAQHLNNFVNYATGLFRSTTEDQVVPDINDMKEPSSEETDNKSGQLDKQLEVENAIKLEDKPNLFQTLDKLIPKQSSVCDDPPLYLCLRVGQPKYKQVSQTCPIESYRGNKKKPEYWFSIPREKVDQLYAFFVQWTPDIYGDDDDMDPEQRGFVVFDEDDLESVENLEFVDKHFDSVQKIRKDWEIISKVEAIRRMSSLDIEENYPLPELIGDTTILSCEEHIRQLSNALPPRTIGYPWTLVYSSEVHGFSLKTLYRNMQGLDSPVLLVVEDTTGHIFGAVVNCPLKVSDHFYGTGESFLYTFYPEYKVFHWSGENNFFIKGNQESLAIGAGQGLFGLWFDGDLYHGRSHKCDTFDNDILTEAEDFCVKGFEAWAFI